MRLFASEYRDLGLIRATSQWKERPISYMLPLTSTIVHAHTNTHVRAHTHAILFFFFFKEKFEYKICQRPSRTLLSSHLEGPYLLAGSFLHSVMYIQAWGQGTTVLLRWHNDVSDMGK